MKNQRAIINLNGEQYEYIQEEPTTNEIEKYAKFLGLDLEKDRDLFWVAREGLTAPLPDGWKPCQTKEGDLYYVNFKTGEATWNHPLDDYYHRKVREEKLRKNAIDKNRGNTLPPQVKSNEFETVEKLPTLGKENYQPSPIPKKVRKKKRKLDPTVQFPELPIQRHGKKKSKSFFHGTRNNEPLKTLYSQLRLEIDHLNEVKSNLEDRITKKKRVLKNEIGHLRKKKEELLKTLDSTMVKVDDLQSRLTNEKDKYEKTLYHLQKELANKQGEKESLELEVKGLKVEAKKAKEELRRKLEIGKNSIVVNQSLKEDALMMRKELDSVRQEMNEKESFQSGRMDDINFENKKMKVELGNEKLRNEKLTHKYELETADLANQVKSLEKTQVTLAQMNESLSDKIEQYSNQLKTEMKRANKFELSTKQHEETINNLQNELSVVKEEKNEALLSLKEFQEKLEVITSEKDRYEGTISDLEKQVEVEKNEKKENLDALMKIENERRNEQKRNVENAKVSNDRIAELEKGSEEMEMNTKKLNSKIERLENKVDMCETRNTELVELNEMFRDQNKKLKIEIETTREKLDVEREKCSGIESSRNSLKEVIFELKKQKEEERRQREMMMKKKKEEEEEEERKRKEEEEKKKRKQKKKEEEEEEAERLRKQEEEEEERKRKRKQEEEEEAERMRKKKKEEEDNNNRRKVEEEERRRMSKMKEVSEEEESEQQQQQQPVVGRVEKVEEEEEEEEDVDYEEEEEGEEEEEVSVGKSEEENKEEGRRDSGLLASHEYFNRQGEGEGVLIETSSSEDASKKRRRIRDHQRKNKQKTKKIRVRVEDDDDDDDLNDEELITQKYKKTASSYLLKRLEEEERKLSNLVKFVRQQKKLVIEQQMYLKKARSDWRRDLRIAKKQKKGIKGSGTSSGSYSYLSKVKNFLDHQARCVNSLTKQVNGFQKVIYLRKKKVKILKNQVLKYSVENIDDDIEEEEEEEVYDGKNSSSSMMNEEEEEDGDSTASSVDTTATTTSATSSSGGDLPFISPIKNRKKRTKNGKSNNKLNNSAKRLFEENREIKDLLGRIEKEIFSLNFNIRKSQQQESKILDQKFSEEEKQVTRNHHQQVEHERERKRFHPSGVRSSVGSYRKYNPSSYPTRHFHPQDSIRMQQLSQQKQQRLQQQQQQQQQSEMDNNNNNNNVLHHEMSRKWDDYIVNWNRTYNDPKATSNFRMKMMKWTEERKNDRKILDDHCNWLRNFQKEIENSSFKSSQEEKKRR